MDEKKEKGFTFYFAAPRCGFCGNAVYTWEEGFHRKISCKKYPNLDMTDFSVCSDYDPHGDK